MYLLQATTEVTTDWTGPFISGALLAFIVYALGAIILYFIVSLAIRSGMKGLRKERRIANELFGEQLKSQGVDASRIDSILHAK